MNLCTVFVILIIYFSCVVNFDYYKTASKEEEYYYLRVFQYTYEKANYCGIQVSCSLLLLVHTIRAFNILRASQTFGPMSEIIVNMLLELFKFMMIYGCIILIFAGSMRIMFFTLPEFDSITETLVTLFSASLSDFDFSIFQSEFMVIDKLYGYLFMGLFLLVSAIALLNFLIAVISNVYEKLNKIKIGLYLKSLICIRQVMQHDDRYSCLVSSVPPLNIVPFVMTPVVLWMQSKKLNYWILHYEYLAVALVGMIVYLILAVICMPIAYILLIWKIFKGLSCSRHSGKSKCTQIFDLVLFIFFGLLMLIGRTVYDFCIFVSELYSTNLIKPSNIKSTSVNTRNTITREIDQNFYLLFLLFLKQYPCKKIHSKRLIADLRSLLDIHHQLRMVIFYGNNQRKTFKPRSALWDTENLNKTLTKQYKEDLDELKTLIFNSYSPKEILEQFNIIKKVINKCSIPNMLKERLDLHPNLKNFTLQMRNSILGCSRGSIIDDMFHNPALKRSETQKERLIKTHFQTIFYIPEFLDITFNLQSKKVFHEIIYANVHDCPNIFKFTKAGRHRFNQLQKDSLKINLELLREQHHTKVPCIQDLKLLEVARNYNCLVEYSKNIGL